MKTVASFLSATARHLRGEAVCGPVAPQTPADHSHTRINSSIAPKTLAPKDQRTMTRLFVTSPLANAANLTLAEIDRLDVIYLSADVQRAAGQLRLKRQHLDELASFRSAIAEAIEISDRTGIAVVEVLRQLAEDADEAISAVREDHSAHNAVSRTRAERLKPLVEAVSKRLTHLDLERKGIVSHIDALVRSASMHDAPAVRYATLKSMHLTDEQIAKLGVPQPEDPASKIAAYRARIAEIDAELPVLIAVSADPFKDAAPLEALDWFAESPAAAAHYAAKSALV